MKTKIIIEKLQRKWFPSEDDKIWKQWVDYKRRETGDLIKLLNCDIRDSLKKRAIFLLIVPSSEFNPIYWTEEVGKFYHKFDFLKTLNPGLLSYVTDLIVEFYGMLMPMHCDKPKHYTEGGGGITVFWSVPDKYHDALYYYNNCILQLLTILPEEQCDRIFSLFSLRDISTYWNMEDASGYNPFQSLLYSDVNEKWKKQADGKMRQIIIDELSGKTKPREEWENALKCYSYIITLQLYGEKIPYSVDLFADQINFLVSEDHYGEELINSWNVVKLLQILSADIYKEIRYKVAKFMVVGNKGEFSIHSEETLQGAKMMLDEFGQDEKELTQRIQSAIEEYEKKSIESKNEKSLAEKSEDKIMSQMK